MSVMRLTEASVQELLNGWFEDLQDAALVKPPTLCLVPGVGSAPRFKQFAALDECRGFKLFRIHCDCPCDQKVADIIGTSEEVLKMLAPPTATMQAGKNLQFQGSEEPDDRSRLLESHHLLMRPCLDHGKATFLHLSMRSEMHDDYIEITRHGRLFDTKITHGAWDPATFCDQLVKWIGEDSTEVGVALAQFVCHLYDFFIEKQFVTLEIARIAFVAGLLDVQGVHAEIDRTATADLSTWKSRDGVDPVDLDSLACQNNETWRTYTKLHSPMKSFLHLSTDYMHNNVWTMVDDADVLSCCLDTINSLQTSKTSAPKIKFAGSDEAPAFDVPLPELLTVANAGFCSSSLPYAQQLLYAKRLLKFIGDGEGKQKRLLLVSAQFDRSHGVEVMTRAMMSVRQSAFPWELLHVCIHSRDLGCGERSVTELQNLTERLGARFSFFDSAATIQKFVTEALGKSAADESHPVEQSDADRTESFLLTGVASNSDASAQSSTDNTYGSDQALSCTDSGVRSSAISLASSGRPIPEQSELTVQEDVSGSVIILGHNSQAVQAMFDFDHSLHRVVPTVHACVNPLNRGTTYSKFYLGSRLIHVPTYPDFRDAQRNDRTCTIVSYINGDSVFALLKTPLMEHRLKSVVLMGGNISLRQLREFTLMAEKYECPVIGPSSAGGLFEGPTLICNNTSSKPFVPLLRTNGNVAVVTKIGGRWNGLLVDVYRTISENTFGLCGAVDIGMGRFHGTGLLKQISVFDKDPRVKFVVMIGTAEGNDEYEVVEALKDGKLSKPLIALCIERGAMPTMLSSPSATKAVEKNKALNAAGARVPNGYADLENVLKEVDQHLVKKAIDGQAATLSHPTALGEEWAREVIRPPVFSYDSLVSTARNGQHTYAGHDVSQSFSQAYSLGCSLSLLWFKRELPTFCYQFFEMTLLLLSDVGTTTSNNTVVCARSGNDPISSLVSGMLATSNEVNLEQTLREFREARNKWLAPREVVISMKGKRLRGIGYHAKATFPDPRSDLLQQFVTELKDSKVIKETPLYDFAKQIADITSKIMPNLLLNLEGAIAVLFDDLLRASGAFTNLEMDQLHTAGYLNSFSLLSNITGFIGQYIEESTDSMHPFSSKRDHIAFLLPEADVEPSPCRDYGYHKFSSQAPSKMPEVTCVSPFEPVGSFFATVAEAE